jgi:hypothetical protein
MIDIKLILAFLVLVAGVMFIGEEIKAFFDKLLERRYAPLPKLDSRALAHNNRL